MAERKGNSSVAELSPKDELRKEFQHLLTALAGRAMSGATDRVGGVSEKLSSVANGGGGGGAVGKAVEKVTEGKSPGKAGLAAGFEGVKDKVKGVFGKGGGGNGSAGGEKNLKVTNIIEEIDIGAPVDVVYNQWTQFQDWSDFMKKLEDVDQQEDEKLNFKAQVFWSHRTWEGHIIDQVPNQHIVWESKGQKGRVEGTVTFHELAPRLTRVLVDLEYYPQGLFEQTGNLWRAQGRRARLELKHFRRHVMTQAMLHPEELEGWHGEIHDGEVTRSNEDAMSDSDDSGDSDDRDAEDEHDEPAERDEEDDEGAEDEYDDEGAEEDSDEDPEEGAEDEDVDDEYEDEGAEDEDEDEDERPSGNGRARRRAGSGSR